MVPWHRSVSSTSATCTGIWFPARTSAATEPAGWKVGSPEWPPSSHGSAPSGPTPCWSTPATPSRAAPRRCSRGARRWSTSSMPSARMCSPPATGYLSGRSASGGPGPPLAGRTGLQRLPTALRLAPPRLASRRPLGFGAVSERAIRARPVGAEGSASAATPRSRPVADLRAAGGAWSRVRPRRHPSPRTPRLDVVPPRCTRAHRRRTTVPRWGRGRWTRRGVTDWSHAGRGLDPDPEGRLEDAPPVPAARLRARESDHGPCSPPIDEVGGGGFARPGAARPGIGPGRIGPFAVRRHVAPALRLEAVPPAVGARWGGECPGGRGWGGPWGEGVVPPGRGGRSPRAGGAGPGESTGLGGGGAVDGGPPPGPASAPPPGRSGRWTRWAPWRCSGRVAWRWTSPRS